ncbi:MAG TPA: glycosyltransferase family 39 protein [Ardenticatenaceae bacterium]|nr:glycosyltransferase family 39 protein [Ardenticatenaceae bacterium]
MHEDEAIYASWALAIRAGDWWLTHTPVDKPPLFFYPLAASLALFGATEAAARLPGLLATGGAALLIFRLVAARSTRRSALGAALLFLAAPLTQSYAASAFTDPLMLLLALASAERAQRRRARSSGVLLALALLTKPTALVFAPLVLALLDDDTSLPIPQSLISTLHAFTLALAAVLLAAWAWDASRYAPSWWMAGARAYGELGRPTVSLVAWLRWLFLGLGPLLVGLRAGRRREAPPGRVEGVLAATMLLFVPVHLLLGLQPWDRYLLPLAALLAIVGGWRLVESARPAVVAALLALPLVWLTSLGRTELGGRDGRWAGVAELGAALHTLPAEATVLYEELGRPLAFYAHGASARLVWAPDGPTVARALAASPGQVYVAVRRETLSAYCQPPLATAERFGHFVLAPVTGACRAALLRK